MPEVNVRATGSGHPEPRHPRCSAFLPGRNGVDSPRVGAVFPWRPIQPPLAHRMASDPHVSAPPRRRELPVWLPWLAAPAFALLPIAGCGAAATLKNAAHTAAAPAACPPPLVPITAVVTALPGGR
jgi:hypothetical protein